MEHLTSNEVLENIRAAGYNPRAPFDYRRVQYKVIQFLRLCVTWGKNLERKTAFRALESMLALIGLGTFVGDYASMKPWLLLPITVVFGATWYGAYLFHLNTGVTSGSR